MALILKILVYRCFENVYLYSEFGVEEIGKIDKDHYKYAWRYLDHPSEIRI